MEIEHKIIASLCYFSIFFAPFLFPLIVYFVTTGEVRRHAKRALLSHILPFILVIVVIALGIALFDNAAAFYTVVVGIVLSVIVYFVFFVWNIVQGIKVFQ
ncbi:DUF4870 domain-containing protein [Virgibacillus sp. 179-BFC.A HS]|uniref:DUF4870 domain-containing protein n=1 Tax=Tigheibacillus jepli TaxID=3035914 RepID=A0ABU5CDG1_9BACI|nr:DUF4870 domain-containing protein [Virgibacillus sp. 179-BFC.A HS]MDY0404377.1 DUF4870 domain-containing protein [Virgibacillus sp. 179-BFC.A HS]